jgi:hypothetical protein
MSDKPDIEPFKDAVKRSWNAHAVDMLREWLVAAEQGQLREVVLVGVFTNEDGETLHKWCATGTLSHSNRVGLLELAKFDWLHDIVHDR